MVCFFHTHTVVWLASLLALFIIFGPVLFKKKKKKNENESSPVPEYSRQTKSCVYLHKIGCGQTVDKIKMLESKGSSIETYMM